MRAVCGFCEKLKDKVYRHHRRGSLRCPACYRLFHSDLCADCGQWKPVSTRLAGGGALCENCAAKKRPRVTCVKCGKPEIVAKWVAKGKALGRKCYAKGYKRPKARCFWCGEEKPVHKRTPQGPLCRRCFDELRAPASQKSRNQ